MNTNIAKQYNAWAVEHDEKTLQYDKQSRASFYAMFNFETKGKKLLDIACASGHDLEYYRDTLGCDVYGVDASDEEVKLAHKRLGQSNSVKVGYADALPFDDDSFDIVVSKYAPQGFDDIESFYKEANRVLKPGGYFLILATHPMRHFLEKTAKPRNYFKKEIVTSWIYDHTLPLREVSHTLNDYFSQYFFSNFILEEYRENYDGSEVQGGTDAINGDKYPGYFTYRAKKK